MSRPIYALPIYELFCKLDWRNKLLAMLAAS